MRNILKLFNNKRINFKINSINHILKINKNNCSKDKKYKRIEGY
jgi:hypothetical protein